MGVPRMRRQSVKTWFAWVSGGWLAVGVMACGGALGGEGESCRARSDCASGLVCLTQTCQQATSDVDSATQPATPGSAGDLGESCQARRDCQPPLRCLDRVCQAGLDDTERVLPISMSTGTFGALGESCSARNDCAEGLSCIQSTCRRDSTGIARTAKSCDRVECEASEDCCADFVPNPDCPTFEANCASDPIFCNTFNNLCLCARECRDSLCVGAAPGCETDEECGSAQTPYCIEGACRQCRDDANCGGGLKCRQGVCDVPCVRDEQCPLLSACQEGDCVEVGCRSQRECYFVTRDARVDCIGGDCVVPCQRDADCSDDDFQICDRGQCTFVGCETDAECRAVLGLENTNERVTARCRE